MYAEATVDGSDATIWAPSERTAGLTVDLGARTRLDGVAVHWTDTRPSSSTIETSLDGASWSTKTSNTSARYVRVTLTRGSDTKRTGIREVIATRR